MGLWAAAFSVAGIVGLVPLWFLGALGPFELTWFLRLLVQTLFRWGLGGAGMGLAFASAVLVGGRKSTFIALSPRRFALWGFVAGAVVPIGGAMIAELTGHSSVAINVRAGLIFAGICGVLGATLASAMLRAARRAPASFDDADRVRVPVM
jgi:hypothetical protein